MRILILSDGRLGHLNQSIALAKYLGYEYDIVEVRFKSRFLKSITYLLDRCNILSKRVFVADVKKSYNVVVGSGSTTYYAVKTLAKDMRAKSIVMMLPRGYRYDFDYIFSQSHDNAPKYKNIIEIPANFAYVEPKGIYLSNRKSIAIIVGGDNSIFAISKERLKSQLDFIVGYYDGYDIAITTSPRTSKEIESLVESYHFEYEVIFSKNRVNPISDFLEQCEVVFITGDSTSMISEAISYGTSDVVILPLDSKKDNKFEHFIEDLQKDGYVHIYNGKIESKNSKIDFRKYLKGVTL